MTHLRLFLRGLTALILYREALVRILHSVAAGFNNAVTVTL